MELFTKIQRWINHTGMMCPKQGKQLSTNLLVICSTENQCLGNNSELYRLIYVSSQMGVISRICVQVEEDNSCCFSLEFSALIYGSLLINRGS